MSAVATCYLRRCVHGTVLLELLDHAFQIRIATAKASCEPVPTTLRNPLVISDNLELTGLPGFEDRFNSKALFDEGHETRDLGLVVQSCRAVNDLDLHLFSDLQSVVRLSLRASLWVI